MRALECERSNSISKGFSPKNVIFSNGPRINSEYPNPLVPNMMSIKFRKKIGWKVSVGGVKVDIFAEVGLVTGFLTVLE